MSKSSKQAGEKKLKPTLPRPQKATTGSDHKSSPDKIKSSTLKSPDTTSSLPKVLIVDDTVFTIQIIQMYLNQVLKIEVDQAINGDDAIEKCKARVKKN